MNKFDYVKPSNLDEAFELANKNSSSFFLAGGTDLMVKVKNKIIDPEVLIDLEGISELHGIVLEEGQIKIGSLVTHTEIANSELIRKHAPALALAADLIGAPQIRNRGSIGGNIANASPAADTVPALIALGAVVILQSREGLRNLSLEEFITGPGKTVLKTHELIKGIWITPQKPNQGSNFAKIGKRKALAISIVNTGVFVEIDPQLKIFTDVRIAVGSVAPKVVRAREIEMLLKGSICSKYNIEQINHIDVDTIKPIDDVRSTAKYRLNVSNFLIQKTVKDTIEKMGLEFM